MTIMIQKRGLNGQISSIFLPSRWLRDLSEEEAHDLASHVLSSSLLMIHDAVGRGPRPARNTATLAFQKLEIR